MQYKEYSFKSCSVSLRLNPYDSSVFEGPIYDIKILAISDGKQAAKDILSLLSYVKAVAVTSSSSILDHSVNVVLQQSGFVVADSTIEPYIHRDWRNAAPETDSQIQVIDQPSEAHRTAAREMARICFREQRYHLDHRFDNTLADSRYARWVESTASSQEQNLMVLVNQEELISFFITQNVNHNDSVYWHLNAVHPNYQGKGLGKICWNKMLNYHWAKGASSINTTISCHNNKVLGLYSWLGFRFKNPMIKMHWHRD